MTPKTTWTNWPTIRPCELAILGSARASERRKSGWPVSPPSRDWLAALGNYKPNIEQLREALADWSARHLRATGNDHTARRITIDIDSFPIPGLWASRRA